MKPWIHALNSVKKFGGLPDDYIAVHNWLDHSKAHFPDMRHRALLHSSFGIYVCEQVFGTWFNRKSDGVTTQTRDIAEHHVIEDMGYIPTVQDYLKDLPFYPWLGGKKKTKRKTTLAEVDGLDASQLTFDNAPAILPNRGTLIID